MGLIKKKVTNLISEKEMKDNLEKLKTERVNNCAEEIDEVLKKFNCIIASVNSIKDNFQLVNSIKIVSL
jgi:hypothetical protein